MTAVVVRSQRIRLARVIWRKSNIELWFRASWRMAMTHHERKLSKSNVRIHTRGEDYALQIPKKNEKKNISILLKPNVINQCETKHGRQSHCWPGWRWRNAWQSLKPTWRNTAQHTGNYDVPIPQRMGIELCRCHKWNTLWRIHSIPCLKTPCLTTCKSLY